MAEAITSSVIPFELESENQKDKIKEITAAKIAADTIIPYLV